MLEHKNSTRLRAAVALAAATLATIGALAAAAQPASAQPTGSQAVGSQPTAAQPTAAQPGPAGVAEVETSFGVNGPNSPYPGPGWFYWQTYGNQTQCLLDGFYWVSQGIIRGVTCPFRFDGLGFDQWLIY